MSTYTVRLPSAIAIRQIRSVFFTARFFLESPTEIVLSFHPQRTFLDPLGMSLLGAWASYWQERGVAIRCENLGSSGLAYAERMGLFRILDVAFRGGVQPHEASGRFVELRRIDIQDDLSRLCAEIGGVLRVPHLIE